jgi:8-oxo-dGTP diphosphatase
MEVPIFNIRVYGILTNEQGQLLVTDEHRLGMRMTKFPGGGLKFGEGTIDCLRREFREELDMEIVDLKHFYTTDYFQPTMLLQVSQQLISIYYCVRVVEPQNVPVSARRFDFEDTDGAQTFRWIDIATADEFTFPIDKKVLAMVKEKYVPGRFGD